MDSQNVVSDYVNVNLRVKQDFIFFHYSRLIILVYIFIIESIMLLCMQWLLWIVF